MRELVYISGNAPRAISTYVHGLWQRQQLFIEALGPMFDRVHCVFWKGLGPGEFEDDAEVQARFEDAFGRDVASPSCGLPGARRIAVMSTITREASSLARPTRATGASSVHNKRHSWSTAFLQAHQQYSRRDSK